MVRGPEAEPARELVDRAFERGVVERHELPALVAQQMMVVVLSGGVGGLVTGDAVAYVDAADQIVSVQELEDAVDAGPADGALASPSAAQGVLDLERAERAVLAREQLDQPVAGSPAVVSRALEDRTGVLGPLRVGMRPHRTKLSRGHVATRSGRPAEQEPKIENRSHSLLDQRTVRRRSALPTLVALAAALAAAGCGTTALAKPIGNGPIKAVAAENEYANVISQIGGRYVTVTAIESNPSTDPHTFEASPSVAQTVGAARLVVQNGVGYDTFMNKIEAASPTSSRKVIDVQKLLGLPDSTPNPHLWYSPRTMPAVAQALVKDLSAIDPSHAGYFANNAKRFDASLHPWYQALRRFETQHPHSPVATTEPVGDYMLEAAGTTNLTPFAFQADVMNGVDLAPQAVTLQDDLISKHQVKALVYNQQVTDTLTQSFLAEAKRDGVPVVGVYETMPTPGYNYQSWMLAEVHALEKAVANGVSTEKLQ